MSTEKKSGRTSWTIKYAILNIAYFTAFCTIHACAAVYLLANGFTNTEVGILLAVSNIASAILQPVIAAMIDGPGRLTNRAYVMFSVLGIMAGCVLLMLLPGQKLPIFIIFALIYTLQFVYQPVLTALCFEYQRAGCDIFYGLARGLGSAGFAFTALFIGNYVERNGVSVLAWVSIASMAVSAVVLLFFIKPRNGEDASGAGEEASAKSALQGAAHNGISSFAKTYPAFVLFLAAIVCFFFAHNMINDFMIQIIRNLGGGETELGISNFLQAILELPVMALSGLILKKISSGKLLVVSGTAFFVKILILVFATGMAHMYLSQSLQLFAYAIFVPAGACYVSATMEEADQVKGQALITSAITVGGVFSNFISGYILDHFSIRAMLLVGTVVCGIGVVTGYIAMTRLPHHKASS